VGVIGNNAEMRFTIILSIAGSLGLFVIFEVKVGDQRCRAAQFSKAKVI